MHLIFGNLTVDDILLKQELDELAAAHPRFKARERECCALQCALFECLTEHVQTSC